MFLKFDNGLIRTTRFDSECSDLADRHYSRQSNGQLQFVPPGESIVLRNAEGTCVFVWIRNVVPRYDKQVGINCTIFRNESCRRSSDIILEAELFAVERWGNVRAFTYIDAEKIQSVNPGYCFKKAGWKSAGRSKSGLILLEKWLSAKSSKPVSA
jgi:hypothetical protein